MTTTFDIKSDFPIFDLHPNLSYFDSSSTALIPRVSIDAITKFLSETVSSARRGAHHLVTTSNTKIDKIRNSVAEFLGVDSTNISFQSSVPSAVASIVYGFDWLSEKKNKVVIAENEEHSIMASILRAAQVLNLDIELLPINEKGLLILDNLESIIDENTGIVAANHTTLAHGIENPLQEIAKKSHENGAIVISDMTRTFDFYTNSIKRYDSDVIFVSGNNGFLSPPGLIIQYIDNSLGQKIDPGILGGSSVANIHRLNFDIALQPDKFESGIINVPAIMGLGSSIEYLNTFNPANLIGHIEEMKKYLITSLTDIEQVNLYYNSSSSSPIISFTLGEESDIGCHDIALFLDQFDIAVRSGFLCAHPLVSKLAIDGVVQISLHIYNTTTDCQNLIEAVKTIVNDFL